MTEEAHWNSASLSANGTLTKTLDAFGAKNLRIQVKSDNTYSVDVEWKDGEGNVIRTETDVLGGTLTGGNWNRTDQTVFSPHVKVILNEDAGSDSTANGNVYFV